MVWKESYQAYDRCGGIWDFSIFAMWRYLKFLHMADFSPLVPVSGNRDKSQVLTLVCFKMSTRVLNLASCRWVLTDPCVPGSCHSLYTPISLQPRRSMETIGMSQTVLLTENWTDSWTKQFALILSFPCFMPLMNVYLGMIHISRTSLPISPRNRHAGLCFWMIWRMRTSVVLYL